MSRTIFFGSLDVSFPDSFNLQGSRDVVWVPSFRMFFFLKKKVTTFLAIFCALLASVLASLRACCCRRCRLASEEPGSSAPAQRLTQMFLQACGCGCWSEGVISFFFFVLGVTFRFWERS